MAVSGIKPNRITYNISSAPVPRSEREGARATLGTQLSCSLNNTLGGGPAKGLRVALPTPKPAEERERARVTERKLCCDLTEKALAGP